MDSPLIGTFDFLPLTLRDELLVEYSKISDGFFEGKWEPSELSGGKFCEVVYSILDDYSSGKYPNNAQKPPRMENACNNLANSTTLPDSLRLSVPRALIFLYDVRNRRGVGHVGGGGIDPNHMDSLVVLGIVKWIMAELVRVLHSTSVDEARKVVEELSTKIIPLVWDANGVKRVLDKMGARDQMLVLLYASNDSVSVASLAQSIEYSNVSAFKTKIIKPCHKDRLVEFDGGKNIVILTPNGIEEAESIIRAHRS